MHHQEIHKAEHLQCYFEHHHSVGIPRVKTPEKMTLTHAVLDQIVQRRHTAAGF